MRSTPSITLLLALLSAGCAGPSPAPASSPAPGAPPGPVPAPAREGAHVVLADGKSPAFAADADAILTELEAWRGLAFREDLLVELVSPEDVADQKLNGWYEPSTKRLVVVEGNTDRMGRGTLLHEMFHALQDQHFDLGRLHREAEPLGRDAQRALQALIEGEAMFAVSEIMSYDFEQHAHLPETGPIDPDRFQKIFHYGAGLRYVRALRDAGGWARVDAAFASPPRTTAQIYHPDRAARARVNLPVAPLDTLGPGQLRGEYGLYLYLAQPEEQRPQAATLAADLLADMEYPVEGGSIWVLLVGSAEAADAIDAAAGKDVAVAKMQKTSGPDGRLITLHLVD